ncbi:MAG: AGE family epimerase/isomerase [Rhizobiaceae bacterium]|nr:AGE family epimerase/isomerase [Rhizobiaceae bacterium]
MTQWLIEAALPLWSRHGVDRVSGGFYEKLDFSLKPIDEPRRARLVSRQIYCFAVGHELGWTGPAKELVDHGLDFLTTHLLRDDGTVIQSIGVQSGEIDDRYDPLDYAFVLFALASAGRRLADRERMHGLAIHVRQRLFEGWAHPLGGFAETRLPLRSNPQMHLFEAFLAWDELVGGADSSWRRAADAIGELALNRLIDPVSGALAEFFDADWRPTADSMGILVEPGHQFEWSWLLARWSIASGRDDAFKAARLLAEIGERHGIDTDRGVAVDALHHTLGIRDHQAKLWPQTERIKAWHAMSVHPLNSPVERRKAALLLPAAIAGLTPYLTDDPTGLWHEIMLADGSFAKHPIKASSLYHLTCAIHTLNSTALAENPW